MIDPNSLEGFLLINKPIGITSSYCINRLKHALRGRTRIGHSGTLDSFADGLMIIGIGRSATRHLSKLTELDKWYTATGRLGMLTDTLDFTGRLLKDEEIPEITEDQIRTAITNLGTQYRQIPPIFSALKYQGRSLSDLAREATLTKEQLQTIAHEKTKIITIYSCELLSLNLPFFTIEAHVSHGTYIRVLLNDIALMLGTYASTHELSRTKIGPFSVQQAIPLKKFNTIDDIGANLISTDQILQQLSNEG